MIWINGKKLRDPDHIQYIFHPSDMVAARGKMSVTAKWQHLTETECALALLPAMGQVQVTVTDPALNAERSFEALMVVGRCERAQGGYGAMEVTLTEVLA